MYKSFYAVSVCYKAKGCMVMKRSPKMAFNLFPPHHFWYGIGLLILGFVVLWTELPYHDVIAWMLAGAGGGLVAHDIHEHTHTIEAHEDPRHPKY